MHVHATVILVFGIVTFSWLLIGQNSLTGQCGSNTQRIYKLFGIPILQQSLEMDIFYRNLITINFTLKLTQILFVIGIVL